MKKATLATTFARLLTLAQRDHHAGQPPRPGLCPPGRQPWTAADLVAQEALYAIQGDLLGILLEVAQALGPTMVDRLTKALPWAYQVAP